VTIPAIPPPITTIRCISLALLLLPRMGEVKQESGSLTCNSFNVLRRIPHTDPGLM